MSLINHREYRLEERTNFPDYLTFERVVEPGYFDIVNDEDMKLVEAWCEEHGCGKRSSWAQFFFETPDQMTMFKLRWS